VHLLGGLALLAGFYARWAAALLALICLGTAFGVHLPAGDQGNSKRSAIGTLRLVSAMG
jgi:uncharacterized membrane protein YphA (DoxX/SURF4 family)